ncbi:MAG: hypothetical protein K8F32_04600 [Rhodocyclaceae bacterium]|nr:hypothetical protein [Rhodocyclaceae bacterium]GIK23772.1 MAG: hypothetical protein BroJett006_00180 [Betaproteobacteria bacterium]
MKRILCLALAAGLGAAHAQQHDPAMHMQHHGQPPAQAAKTPQAMPKDTRQSVYFPKVLREHTLANMRDHLLALQEIQAALAQQEYDKAADIAEHRLGMSSLSLHGAHDVAKYMPKGMQDAGTAMHRNASRFAVAAKDASATGDVRPALAALAATTAQCVACHAGYRVK